MLAPWNCQTPWRKQQRGAEEQGAGHHAEDEAIDRRLEAAVVEVDVEFAALDLLQDVADAARQDLDELLDFGIDATHLLHLPHGESRRRSIVFWYGSTSSIKLKWGSSSRPVPSSMIRTLISIASVVGRAMW